jgi:hypothetical protein
VDPAVLRADFCAHQPWREDAVAQEPFLEAPKHSIPVLAGAQVDVAGVVIDNSFRTLERVGGRRSLPAIAGAGDVLVDDRAMTSR